MEKQTVAEVLKSASQKPSGVQLEKFDPLENIPTLTVGDDGDITTGMVLTGRFVSSDRISSPKFNMSKERDENGVTVQYLHVLEALDGSRFGIWSTGELKAAFAKLQAGELISIKYNGKGKNAKGQDQHMFEYSRPKAAAPTVQ